MIVTLLFGVLMVKAEAATQVTVLKNFPKYPKYWENNPSVSDYSRWFSSRVQLSRRDCVTAHLTYTPTCSLIFAALDTLSFFNRVFLWYHSNNVLPFFRFSYYISETLTLNTVSLRVGNVIFVLT